VEPFLGEIRLVPFSFAPRGWAYCEGQLLPINQNQALFALLGTNFGGNGKTTFALPDLRGRVPVGAGLAASGSAYTLGVAGGQESTKLTVAQLPAHAHRVRASSTATGKSPANAVPAAGGSYSTSHDVTMAGDMLARVGGGRAHDNRQPYLTLNWIIALQGIFPSQS